MGEYQGGELEFDFRNYDPHGDESKHRQWDVKTITKRIYYCISFCVVIELNQ